MARDRRKNREKKKEQKMLDRNNEYGIADPTPFEAVKLIMEKDKQKRG